MSEWYLIYKSVHIVSVVAWFAALFYLPRLFVYHADHKVDIFFVMERRLYRGIAWPAALMTTFSGLMMLHAQVGLMHLGFMKAKLGLVGLLWIYHGVLGGHIKRFKLGSPRSSTYYRFLNEFPTLILLGVVFLVILRPVW